jgi:hypothetical protein
VEYLPPPQDPLPGLRPEDLRPLSRPSRLWRIYFAGGKHPSTWNGFRSFGPRTQGRFDHHSPPPRSQDRRILYAAWNSSAGLATEAFTCVAEVFQETRVIDRKRNEPWLAGFAMEEDVSLLDVTSGWTGRAGGNQAICSGERSRSRAWSRAIYVQYLDIGGIYYASSTYGPGRAVALYERAGSAMPSRPVFNRPLADPGLTGFLRSAAYELEYLLV